mgnify:CR=1 FL=1
MEVPIALTVSCPSGASETSSGIVTVLAPEGVDCSGCPEDINGNGTVEVSDVLLLLSDFGCTSDCTGADIDGDGQINRKEWKKAMPAIGINHNDYMLNKLFDLFDEDGSGEIDYLELRAALRKPTLRRGGGLGVRLRGALRRQGRGGDDEAQGHESDRREHELRHDQGAMNLRLGHHQPPTCHTNHAPRDGPPMFCASAGSRGAVTRS